MFRGVLAPGRQFPVVCFAEVMSLSAFWAEPGRSTTEETTLGAQASAIRISWAIRVVASPDNKILGQSRTGNSGRMLALLLQGSCDAPMLGRAGITPRFRGAVRPSS